MIFISGLTPNSIIANGISAVLDRAGEPGGRRHHALDDRELADHQPDRDADDDRDRQTRTQRGETGLDVGQTSGVVQYWPASARIADSAGKYAVPLLADSTNHAASAPKAPITPSTVRPRPVVETVIKVVIACPQSQCRQHLVLQSAHQRVQRDPASPLSTMKAYMRAGFPADRDIVIS